MAICSAQGAIEGLSPAAKELFETGGVKVAPLPCPLPSSLWEKLRATELGEPVDWHPPRGELNLGISLYPLGDEYVLLSMKEISGCKASLAQRVYKTMQQVFNRVVAGAAHDLRSPLASMRFNLGVLKNRWEELPSAEIQRLLDAVVAGCQLQLNAIDALVERAASLQAEEISLGSLFDRIQELTSPHFRSGTNRLEVLIDPALKVRGTSLTLEHVFTNLVTNAVEAISRPVTVTIRLIDRTEEQGIILVDDDGPGIPADIRRRIFDPFFTTKVSGTGVGLCLAREAIREIGGELRLVDKSGPGARFEVVLPLIEERPAAAYGA